MDNPRVRMQIICPVCDGSKDRGLVACWPCFRKYDMRNGNPVCEEIIRDRENELRSYTIVIMQASEQAR